MKYVSLSIMNHIITHAALGSVKASQLPDWLLSRGINAVTSAEIAHLCGLPKNQISQRMAALKKSSKIISPARGLWVPVPPEYRTWGAPDPMRYIAPMMRHLNSDYAIGWLTAAAYHGASHQAPQVFQVATSKTVTDREVGRSRLEFFGRSYVHEIGISPELERRTGTRIASVGTTMLMLAADPFECGGMSNVATAVVELAMEHPEYSASLIESAHFFPDSAVRRIGWILSAYNEDGASEALAQYCSELKTEPSFLVPAGRRSGSIDSQWNLLLNEEIDPDLWYPAKASSNGA